MTIVTKLQAAHGQLVTAICLYFDYGDLAAIHTLACASREIYEKHCKAQGRDHMFEYVASANLNRTRKELWDILNGPRNFLKHPEADFDLSASIDLDDDMNATVLFYACHDCAVLCRADAPAEVQAFNMWYLATKFPENRDSSDPDAVAATTIQDRLEATYPALRSAPLRDQKRIGKLMLEQTRVLAAAFAVKPSERDL
jgi:hypothetical protein